MSIEVGYVESTCAIMVRVARWHANGLVFVPASHAKDLEALGLVKDLTHDCH